jgi:hypothetical protein
MNYRIFIIILLVFTAGLANAKTISYKEMVGTDPYTRVYEIMPSTGHGYRIKCTVTSKESIKSVSIYDVDKSYNTLKWEYHNYREPADIVCTRTKNTIVVIGTAKGKKVNVTSTIDELPWHQVFSIDYEPFMKSSDKTMVYWTLNPDSFNGMTFKITKLNIEPVTVSGKPIESVHAHVSLTGMLASFWQAEFWFRKTDSRCLVYKHSRGLKSSMIITEYVSETE